MAGLESEDGERPDWVEIANDGPTAVSLAGFGLSDDPQDPFRWILPDLTLPPDGTLLVFLSGEDRREPGGELHAPFKIPATDGHLQIVDALGAPVDQVDWEFLPADWSLARTKAPGNPWEYFATPTPGSANTGEHRPGFAQAPEILPSGGPTDLLDLTVQVLSNEPGAILRYSLDASVPDETDPEVTGPLLLPGPEGLPAPRATVLRARAFVSGLWPSPVATATWYRPFPGSDLQVWSLVAEPEDLFGPEGLYDNPTLDEERPIHAEAWDAAGNPLLALDSGLQIHGGGSVQFPQKSLRLHFRGGYGASSVAVPLFGPEELTEFHRLLLRNAGQDFGKAHLRDAVGQRLFLGVDLDDQAWEPVLAFLNGEFWGIYNLRERQDRFYAATHHGVDPDNLDLLGDRQQGAQEGDTEAWSELQLFMEQNDLADPSAFAWVESQIDLDAFADYQILEIFLANTDWPTNNLKWWRERSEGSRWRWFLFDLDLGMGNGGPFYHDTLAAALDPSLDFQTVTLRNLLENPDWRRRFVNRFADRLNGRLHPEQSRPVLDAMRSRIEHEIRWHNSLWGVSMQVWEDHIEEVDRFLQRRPEIVRRDLEEEFGLSGRYTLTLAVEPAGGGTIRLEALEVEDAFQGVYFLGNPVDLTAQPAPGFAFAGWSDTGLGSEPSVRLDPATDTTLTAFFAPSPEPPQAVVNEINYNSDSAFNPGDWIELHNPGGGELDLSGWSVRDEEDSHLFVIPDGVRIPAGGFLVLAEDPSAFSALFPAVQPVLGPLGFGLGNSGDSVRVFDSGGALQDLVAYSDDPPWPPAADGQGPTLELVDPFLDNALPASWAAGLPGGTPGQANSTLP